MDMMPFLLFSVYNHSSLLNWLYIETSIFLTFTHLNSGGSILIYSCSTSNLEISFDFYFKDYSILLWPIRLLIFCYICPPPLRVFYQYKDGSWKFGEFWKVNHLIFSGWWNKRRDIIINTWWKEDYKIGGKCKPLFGFVTLYRFSLGLNWPGFL